MPARIISVPAAGNQPKLNVTDDSGLPLLPRMSRPGHGNLTVHGSAASASLTGPRFAMVKMAMMMRYGAYARAISAPESRGTGGLTSPPLDRLSCVPGASPPTRKRRPAELAAGLASRPP